jgi:heme/copper-type cytochrome/quinol oxidase subunit 3
LFTEVEAPGRFGDRPPASTVERPVDNARLALLLFIATEAMLFAGLLGMFVVFRLGSRAWPPLGQPYLPIAVTWANTAVLLASGWTMWRAAVASRRREVRAELIVTLVLACTFLVVQGFEWVRLIHHGLTLSSSVYGGTFYVLIGLHGAHVLGAVIWLAALMGRNPSRHDPTARADAIGLCGIYWAFVCGLWPVLFWLVYLL